MKESQLSPTSLSGQAVLLENHERWIIAYGITTALDKAAPKIFNHRLVGHEVEHILLPTQITIKDTREGEVEMKQVIFPGYFFFGVTTDRPTWWELEDDIPEILNFLKRCTNRKDPEQISFLSVTDRKHIADMVREAPKHHTIVKKFSVGDKIFVAAGSFKNLAGHITEIESRKRRAKVAIEVENSVFPTWIPLFDIEVIAKREVQARQEEQPQSG